MKKELGTAIPLDKITSLYTNQSLSEVEVHITHFLSRMEASESKYDLHFLFPLSFSFSFSFSFSISISISISIDERNDNNKKKNNNNKKKIL
jgi:hypothetical protein